MVNPTGVITGLSISTVIFLYIAVFVFEKKIFLSDFLNQSEAVAAISLWPRELGCIWSGPITNCS
ncbi:MAG: hypothetical protein NC238_01335, partial [Dehalobacter sp.]|nr:hypothetical protein [Dehalobacter sp.]